MRFCARCLGASVGHIGAAINFAAAAMPSLYCALAGLLVMFTDWMLQNRFRLYHSNLARLVTGIAGGYAVGLVIWKVVTGLLNIVW